MKTIQIIVISFILLVPTSSISAQTQTDIPEWVKNNADWWSQGLISDKDFAIGLGFMVKERIVQVDSVNVDSEGDIIIDDNIVIPEWIRNNAKWWVSGEISDNDFQSGIGFMIKNNIISFQNENLCSDILTTGTIDCLKFSIRSSEENTDSIMNDLSSYYSPVHDLHPPYSFGTLVGNPCNLSELRSKVAWDFASEREKMYARSLNAAIYQITSPDGNVEQGIAIVEMDPNNEGHYRISDNVPTPIFGIWNFEIISLGQYDFNALGDSKLKTSFTYHADTVVLIEVPECIVEEDVLETAENVISENYDSSNDSSQCTLDKFGYGEIIVHDKWGSYTKISDEEGYEIQWGWVLEYKDPQYSTAGILVNFDTTGPYPYETTDWAYANEIGTLDSVWWTSNPGTYTFEIRDFENIGSYCGDGDRITIQIE